MEIKLLQNDGEGQGYTKKLKCVLNSYYILSIVFFIAVYMHVIVIYVYNYRITRNNKQTTSQWLLNLRTF